MARSAGENGHEIAILKERLDSFVELMRERELRYQERFESIKESTASAFAASKEAVEKAEHSQREYNVSHNGLITKMDDQYSHMMPRTEANSQFANIGDKIEAAKDDMNSKMDVLGREIRDLRESRSEGSGTKAGSREGWGYAFGVIMFIVAVASLLFGRG